MDAELRDRMRGSLSHNTVCLDGKPQSIPGGPFHWSTAAHARLQGSRHNAYFDWAEGAHDGYAPVEHRRSVIRAADAGWLIVDEIRRTELDGVRDAIHSAWSHWHFHPEWMLREEAKGVLRATHLNGAETWLLFDAGHVALVHGDDRSGLGWYAPVYGTLLPTWSAQITRELRLPFSMVSWIGAATAHSTPELQRIAANAEPGDTIAARVANGDFASVYLLRPGDPSSRDGRGCGAVDYQTDARVLHFRTRGERLVALDVVDASHALALRDGWLSVEANEPVRDLHVRLLDDLLQLSASEPPRQLRLLGDALRSIRAIRLNGRSYPLAVGDPPETLLISGADWTARPLVRLGVPFALDEMHPSRV
jgi:hypothetical protein